MKDQVQDLLSRYTYNPRSGKQLSPKLQAFKAVHSQTNQPVTIKLISSPPPDLYRYLQKLKDTKSDYVIRITDMALSQTRAAVAFQDAPHGTLAAALTKCRRLEDSDAIFVAKIIINGHIDVLRNGGQWCGGLGDIEITDTGMKLSWNGGLVAEGNPVPKLIEKLNARDPVEEKGLLPFPKNKQMLDLIKVSSENASEMSLHPLLKKRDKIFKKKGKNWIALRQIKNKSEYFDQTIYLAVSALYGFIRVKVYERGALQKESVALNKTKATFSRIIQTYDEGNSTFILSDYSNDGNLQQYVTKLKGSNVLLKQDQIQFFLYSLMQPIRSIQSTPLQSVNSLHIRNIWIQNGIPRIGQPVPMTLKIQQLMKDRYDVPDFYHRNYKSNPLSHDPSYDTYSLGILLYKLMYTEYPIFPQGRVHIPTTPSYNQRIKSTLEIFLNQGGRLSDIESKIQVSDTVKKQIKENRVRLEQEKVKVSVGRSGNRVTESVVVEEVGNKEEEQEEGKTNEESCWKALCETVQQDQQGRKTQSFFIDCETSPFRKYRIFTKIILIVLMYILVFYLWYLNHIFDLFAKSSVFSPINVTISGTNYTILASDSYTFYAAYNSSGSKDYNTLTNTLGCAVDTSTVNYSTFVRSSSSGWLAYLAMSLVLFGMMILYKVFQIGSYDVIRAVYYYQTRKYNFNISTFVIFNLIYCLGLFSHYFMFDYIFDSQSTPCFGGDQSQWYTSTTYLFTNRNTLYQYILPLIISALLLTTLSFIQILTHEKIKYSKLVNPITLLATFLLALTIMMRVGVYTPFKPSWINSSTWVSMIRNGNYVTVFGMFPELLLLIEMVLSFIVDWIFWRCLDRKVQNMVHDESMSEDHLRGADLDA